MRRHNNNISAVSKELQISRATVRRRLEGAVPASPKPVPAPVPAAESDDADTESPETAEARTLEFRRMFDRSYIIPAAVRKGIQTRLLKQRWMSDSDFQKACGISNTAHWKTHARENNEFEHLRLKIPGSGTLIWAYNKSYRDQLLGKALS